MAEELVGSNRFGLPSGLALWAPIDNGSAFSHFIEGDRCRRLPAPSRAQLRRTAARILAQGTPPGVPGSRTGLILGKVQSGKTLSFVSVVAMGADNGVGVVVLLAGTKNKLLTQSTDRLNEQLPRSQFLFVEFTHNTQQQEFVRHVRHSLGRPRGKTLFITLLKRTQMSTDRPVQGIDALVKRFEGLPQALRERLANTSVLLIDDEADEVSLDAARLRRASNPATDPTPTYQAIERLRNCLPSHTYLQYTATPQANLLNAITDHLSPDFGQLLEPGEGYCGLEEFFPETQLAHVVEIPPADARAVQQGAAVDRPQTLETAILYFFFSTALATQWGDLDLNSECRSLLIHPHVQLLRLDQVKEWTDTYVNRIFSPAVESGLSNRASPDWQEVRRAMQTDIDDLRRRLGVTAPVDEGTLLNDLSDLLGAVKIRLVDGRPENSDPIVWDRHSAWILIGGNVLGRGFTVEGLTTTWMPREAQRIQLDVTQQRGRFFGYRQDYVDYCRIYLTRANRKAYQRFRDHERDLWRHLRQHLERGESLKQWGRVFRLEARYALCRRSIQGVDLRSSDFTERFLVQKHVELGSERPNRLAVRDFVARQSWRDWPRHPDWSLARLHRYAVLPLADVYESLIQPFLFAGKDDVIKQAISSIVWQVLDEDEDAQALVICMRPGNGPLEPGAASPSGYRRTKRSYKPADSSITWYLGGRDKGEATRPGFYHGDVSVRSGGVGAPDGTIDKVTIQLHCPELRENGQGGAVASQAFDLLAVSPPDGLLAAFKLERNRT
jgi:hypothetical protein